MNLQLQMQTQVNTRNHKVAVSSPFHLRSKPHSPISSLAFRSSTVQQPLLPLFHKSNASAFPAKQPIPILQVVSSNSMAGDHATESSPAKALRRILMSPGIQQLPACFDALSAKLVEKAGFQCCLTGGNVPLTSFSARFRFTCFFLYNFFKSFLLMFFVKV